MLIAILCRAGASAIAYASVVSLIFAVRYLDVLRWTLKLTWMALGITIAAEVAGKLVLSNGLATQLRPRKYYTIHRESLDALIGDVHEFLNFFVIESQRILFVENVSASAAVSRLHSWLRPGAQGPCRPACCIGATGKLTLPVRQAAVAAFLSYYLVKVVPYWALAIMATTVVFFTPLIYASNQELIDTQLKHAGELVNAQTAQIRSAAQKHTEQATQMTKQYMGDYTAKAQALINGARHNTEEQIKQTTPRTAPDLASSLKATDFPEAPKEDLKVEAQPAPSAEAEPLLF